MATLCSDTVHGQPRGQSWDDSCLFDTLLMTTIRESLSSGTLILYMTIFKLSKVIFIFYKHKIYSGIKIYKVVIKVSLICTLSMMSASTVWSYICLNAYSVPC